MVRALVSLPAAILLGAALFGSASLKTSAQQPAAAWKERAFEELNKGTAQVAAFSSDGKMLATAFKNAVTLWDTSNGAKIAAVTLPESRKIPLTLSFSPDGKVLAVASAIKGMQGEYVDVLALEKESMLDKLTLRASLEHFMVGFFAPDGKALHLVSTAKGPYRTVAFSTWSPETGKVTSGNAKADNLVATKGTPKGAELPNPWSPRQDSFALNDEGKLFCITNDRNFQVFDLSRQQLLFSAFGGMSADGAPYTCCASVAKAGQPVYGMGSSTGGVFLVGPLDPKLETWTHLASDTRSHPPLTIKGKKRNTVFCVSFSTDGQTMLSFAEDGKLCRHDAGPVLKQLPIKPNKNGAIVYQDVKLKPIDSVQLTKARSMAPLAATAPGSSQSRRSTRCRGLGYGYRKYR